MKKAVSILSFFSILFIFSGCYSYNETEALSIISSAAADKSGDGYTLSVMTLDFNTPSAEDVGKPKVTSAFGKTVSEAAAEVEKKLGSKLYWSHCYAFFIGPEAAADGINPILDYLLLTNNARININILIAKNSKGADFLNATNKEGALKNQGVIFHQVLIKNIKNDASPAFMAYQSINAIGDNKGAFILPAIEMSKDEPGFIISNSAVFSGEKLQNFCDRKYSDLIAILKNECESYIFSVNDPEAGLVSVEVKSIKTKIVPKYENNTVNFTVEIKGVAVIKEQELGKVNSTQKLSSLGNTVNIALSEKISELITYFQQSFGIESLSFGMSAYVKNPSGWKALGSAKHPLEKSVIKIKTNISAKNYGTLTA